MVRLLSFVAALLMMAGIIGTSSPAHAWDYHKYQMSIKDISVSSTTEATDDTHLLVSGYIVDGNTLVETLPARDPFGELEFDVDTPGQDVRRNLNLFDVTLAPGQTCYFVFQIVEDDTDDFNNWMTEGLTAATIIGGALCGVPVSPEQAQAYSEAVQSAVNTLNSNEYFGSVCGKLYYTTSGCDLKMWADNQAYKGGEEGAQGGWTGSEWKFRLRDGGGDYTVSFDLGDLGVAN